MPSTVALEAARGGLRESLALRGEKDDGLAGEIAGGFRCDAEFFEGALEDGLRQEDHAFAAAEGTVVHGAVAVVGPVAEVVGVDEDRPEGGARSGVRGEACSRRSRERV